MKADERLARAIVRERAGGCSDAGGFKGWCEMRIPGVCLGRAANWCHRVPEGQGGPWAASNGLAGCGSGTTGCHGWCHQNPAEAVRKGWVVKSWHDPRKVPVYRWEEFVWLADDGGVTPCTELELIEAGLTLPYDFGGAA